MAKLDVLVCSGSPDGVNPDEIEIKGMGGAELALVTWAEIMGKRGHEIRIFNDPRVENGHKLFGNVWYLPKSHFNPSEERDCLVEFRGPIHTHIHGRPPNTKKIIGWSCDQYSYGDYRAWYSVMDEIVLISPFHKQDHLARYGEYAKRGLPLDLGVRTWEYSPNPKKIKGQTIFCSVPDRGLMILLEYWPEIKERYPELTLMVTSDYTLWGSDNPNNIEYRLKSVSMKDVEFYGKVKRSELVQLQQESELQLYPCIYDENFCIATAECQVAGAIPITSNVGALATTNFMGAQINGMPTSNGVFRSEFIATIGKFVNFPEGEKETLTEKCIEQSRIRFDWDRICAEWEKLIES